MPTPLQVGRVCPQRAARVCTYVTIPAPAPRAAPICESLCRGLFYPGKRNPGSSQHRRQQRQYVWRAQVALPNACASSYVALGALRAALGALIDYLHE